MNQNICNENELLSAIVALINPDYMGNAKFNVKENKSAYNSIIVTSSLTPYRCFNTGELLFARLKTSGKLHYLSFPLRYAKDFDLAGISYSKVQSEDFIRIDLSQFWSIVNDSEFKISFGKILDKIFVGVFSFEAFGCCHKYEACSDAKKCLHQDLAYATACMYRKNLEQGRIFYGKNKNT